MNLLFASQNQHKLLEMATLLIPHDIKMPSDLGISFEFEETEQTFTGNALGKAEHLYNLVHLPTLADDSGLVIDALNGAPGIYSARYGSDAEGRILTSPERNQLVLRQLSNVPEIKRTARFVCAIALVLSSHKKYIVQETVEGYIAKHPYGDGGFGYDPIFLVGETGKTMAELSQQEKNSISHRSLAAKRILGMIKQIEHSEVFHVC